jgi:hypothetical protein
MLEQNKGLLYTESRRIIQIRFVGMTLTFLAGLLLLSYSIYFFYVFETFNNTTSYFPWVWQVNYATLSPVLQLTALGIVSSVFLAGLSIAAAFFFRDVLREVK